MLYIKNFDTISLVRCVQISMKHKQKEFILKTFHIICVYLYIIGIAFLHQLA